MPNGRDTQSDCNSAWATDEHVASRDYAVDLRAAGEEHKPRNVQVDLTEVAPGNFGIKLHGADGVIR